MVSKNLSSLGGCKRRLSRYVSILGFSGMPGGFTLLVKCKDCKFSKEIDPETRLGLSQENKEILNRLLDSKYKLSEFHYCKLEGFLVSNIGLTECDKLESE